MDIKKRILLGLVVLLLIINISNLLTITNITGKATGTISLCINHPPTITTIADQTTIINSSFTLQVETNDTDGNSLTYYDNTTLFNINQSGYISFTPSDADIGTYNLLITVEDDSGCTNSNSTDTFTLTISGVVNNAPTLDTQIPNQTWEQDVQLTGLDLDNYFSDPDNDTLTYTVSKGNNITITIDGNNVATFVPQSGWYGTTWAIFTASDGTDTTNSNNLTLTITQSIVTPPPAAAPGGGGAAAVVVEKEIVPPQPEEVCELESTCGDWLPESCSAGSTQTRSCFITGSDCSVTETLAERDCICQSKWECTIWQPSECPAIGHQSRICKDLNNCERESNLPLHRSCTPAEALAPRTLAGRTALFGQALLQNVRISMIKHSALWLFLILTTIIIVILLSLQLKKRKQKEKVIIKEKIVKVRTPREPKEKVDITNLRRKLGLLRESYQKGYIRRETYEKTREKIERLLGNK